MDETEELHPAGLRTNGAPLIVSTDRAAKVCGVSPDRFREIADKLGIEPILRGGNGTARWSLPEIVERLKSWSSTRPTPLFGYADPKAIIDKGRTRAPRQSFMKGRISKA